MTSFLVTYLILVIQMAVVPHFAIGMATPNLILIGLIGLLFARRNISAQLMAGFGGLLIDLYSPFRFGLYILIYIGIFFLAQRFLKKFLSETTFLAWIGVTALAAAIAEIPTIVLSLSSRLFLTNIGYTLVAAILIYGFVKLLRPKDLIKL